ncbi:uncharacterized protein VNE69_05042 [Vairimorpha necatrix]|uniref:Uncharacterized protein n=1 Tax=Vairimorpha necatrix TaxID=6039 RepID=A0AAX4JBS4_9MICR
MNILKKLISLELIFCGNKKEFDTQCISIIVEDANVKNNNMFRFEETFIRKPFVSLESLALIDDDHDDEAFSFKMTATVSTGTFVEIIIVCILLIFIIYCCH